MNVVTFCIWQLLHIFSTKTTLLKNTFLFAPVFHFPLYYIVKINVESMKEESVVYFDRWALLLVKMFHFLFMARLF